MATASSTMSTSSRRPKPPPRAVMCKVTFEGQTRAVRAACNRARMGTWVGHHSVT